MHGGDFTWEVFRNGGDVKKPSSGSGQKLRDGGSHDEIQGGRKLGKWKTKMLHNY